MRRVVFPVLVVASISFACGDTTTNIINVIQSDDAADAGSDDSRSTDDLRPTDTGQVPGDLLSEPTTIPPADAGDTGSASDVVDTGPEPRLVDKGDLPLGTEASGTVVEGELGHRYLMYGPRGLEIGLQITADERFQGELLVYSPGDDGELGTLYTSIDVEAGTTAVLDRIEFTREGFYSVVVRAHVLGSYIVSASCQSGCETESDIGICPELASSAPPPLGAVLSLFEDREIVIYDGQDAAFLDTYQPSGGYSGSEATAADALAIEAARLEPGAAQFAAVLTERALEVFSFAEGDVYDSISLTEDAAGLTRAITANGVDVLFVVSETGRFSRWDWSSGAAEGSSFSFELGEVTIFDLTSADIHGDGSDELMMLYETPAGKRLLVVQVDDPPMSAVAYVIDDSVRLCEAGDLTGDTQVDIICAHDGYFFGPDNVSLYRFDSEERLTRTFGPVDTPGGNITDLEIGNTGSGENRLYLLDDDGVVSEYSLTEDGVERLFNFSASTTESPDFFALVDTDSDSAFMSLASGPFPSQTSVTPMLAVVVPPAWSGSSDYWAMAGVREEEFVETRVETSVGLSASVSIGYKGEIPKLFSAGIKTTLDRTLRRTVKDYNRIRQGVSFRVTADAEHPTHGAVMLSWSCYDSYTYTIKDGGGHLDGPNSQEVSVNVPRHIGRVLWDLDRYNDNASELGVQPIAPDVVQGDPASYPSSMLDVYGDPVTESQLLIPNPFVLAVSDSVRTEGFYENGVQNWNTENLSTGVSLNASASGAGFAADGTVGVDGSEAHTLRIGESTRFQFGTGAVPDDPDTPVDEYTRYTFQFSPFVYLQDGPDARFFVLYHYVSALGSGYD